MCKGCDKDDLPSSECPVPLSSVSELKPIEIVPSRLFEVIVTGRDFEHTYSDIVKYNYSSSKGGNLGIELRYNNNGDHYRQIHYAKGCWQTVSSGDQAIKIADIEQVKTAWETPNKIKPPEFPITLGDPAI